MKLKHPTHDPKPMDALSYYLQVQREYALARVIRPLEARWGMLAWRPFSRRARGGTG